MNPEVTNQGARVALRPADESDLPFLLDLRIRAMDEHFIASGRPLSREDHRQRVLHKLDSAEVILVDGAAGGLLKVERSGTDWHLIQIQLLPELQNRGIGTQLIKDVIDEARRAGATLRLGVLKVNPARRLYERLGFTVVSETDDSVKMQLPSR